MADACLNKIELTPWDFWGIGLTEFSDLSDEELRLLDRVVALSPVGTSRLDVLRATFEGDERLRVPAAVRSYTMDDQITVEYPLA